MDLGCKQVWHGNAPDINPTLLDDGDPFGQKVNLQIAKLPLDEAQNWYDLFAICKKATTGKPAKKLQKELQTAIQKVGEQEY